MYYYYRSTGLKYPSDRTSDDGVRMVQGGQDKEIDSYHMKISMFQPCHGLELCFPHLPWPWACQNERMAETKSGHVSSIV